MIAMLDGIFRFTLSGIAKMVLVAGIISGCSERKPAGPPEGTENTAAQPAPAASTDPPAEAR